MKAFLLHDHKNQDGLKVLNAIKQSLPNCVSILLTGYASVELAVNVIQDYGAFTCLRKETFRRVDFREVIRQALASPQGLKMKLRIQKRVLLTRQKRKRLVLKLSD